MREQDGLLPAAPTLAPTRPPSLTFLYPFSARRPRTLTCHTKTPPPSPLAERAGGCLGKPRPHGHRHPRDSSWYARCALPHFPSDARGRGARNDGAWPLAASGLHTPCPSGGALVAPRNPITAAALGVPARPTAAHGPAAAPQNLLRGAGWLHWIGGARKKM